MYDRLYLQMEMIMNIDQIKSEWTMWNCGGWHAVHKTTGKKLKAGTYSALLQLCEYTSQRIFDHV